MLNNIFSKGFMILPIIIAVHFVIGVIASIKARKFEIKKMPDFIIRALVFTGFLVLLDYINKVFVINSMGTIATAGIDTLRGLSWLTIILYYVNKIYKNLVYLGMPRLKPIEDNINQNCPIDDDKSSIFSINNEEDNK